MVKPILKLHWGPPADWLTRCVVSATLLLLKDHPHSPSLSQITTAITDTVGLLELEFENRVQDTLKFDVYWRGHLGSYFTIAEDFGSLSFHAIDQLFAHWKPSEDGGFWKGKVGFLEREKFVYTPSNEWLKSRNYEK